MRLYVNIDHVATVREARRTDEPDPVRAAAAAEQGGADGITVHLREDRRHIQDADVRALRTAVRTVLNLELDRRPPQAVSGDARPRAAPGDHHRRRPRARRRQPQDPRGRRAPHGRRHTRQSLHRPRSAHHRSRRRPRRCRGRAAHRPLRPFLAERRRRTARAATCGRPRPRVRPRGARRARAHIRQRAARGRHPGHRGAQHRAFDREQCDLPGNGRSGAAHAALGR